MRLLLLAVVASLTLTGCGAPSSLPEDDQTFCAEQGVKLDPAREQLAEIVDGDRHWSSDGEPFALREVYLDPASNFVRAFEPQDERLAEHVEAVSSAMFYVGSDLLVEPDQAFADDAASSRDALAAIERLQEFCDDEG